jgi:hypothetical protein
MSAVALLGQQVETAWLERMHDLGEPVVIFGRLDQQVVVVAVGHWIRIDRIRLEQDGNQQRREYLPERAGRERRDARGIFRDERVVGLLLRLVVAVGGEIDVEPSAPREKRRKV